MRRARTRQQLLACDGMKRQPGGNCLLLGVGSLLSWNALITPIEYLKLRIAGSAFESSFESMFSTTFTWVSLTSLIIMQKIQHALSLRAREPAPLFAPLPKPDVPRPAPLAGGPTPPRQVRVRVRVRV